MNTQNRSPLLSLVKLSAILLLVSGVCATQARASSGKCNGGSLDQVCVLGEAFESYEHAKESYISILKFDSLMGGEVFLKPRSNASNELTHRLEDKIAKAVVRLMQYLSNEDHQKTKVRCLKKIGLDSNQSVSVAGQNAVLDALHPFMFLLSTAVPDVFGETKAQRQLLFDLFIRLDQVEEPSSGALQFSVPQFEYFKLAMPHYGLVVSQEWLADSSLSVEFWSAQFLVGIISNILKKDLDSSGVRGLAEEVTKCVYL